jgi:hypothetical protein
MSDPSRTNKSRKQDVAHTNGYDMALDIFSGREPPAAKRRKKAGPATATAIAAAHLLDDVAAAPSDTEDVNHRLLEVYKLSKYCGAFEGQRPLDTMGAVKQMLAQQTQDIKQHVDRVLASAAVCAGSSAALNWPGFVQLQQAAQEDQ